jgi:hypothetical protein
MAHFNENEKKKHLLKNLPKAPQKSLQNGHRGVSLLRQQLMYVCAPVRGKYVPTITHWDMQAAAPFLLGFLTYHIPFLSTLNFFSYMYHIIMWKGTSLRSAIAMLHHLATRRVGLG